MLERTGFDLSCSFLAMSPLYVLVKLYRDSRFGNTIVKACTFLNPVASLNEFVQISGGIV